jgi:hypothetical protein
METHAVSFICVYRGIINCEARQAYLLESWSIKEVFPLYNVFHHRVEEPTEWLKNAWRDELTLQLFNFIAIKQGTYVRCAHI